MFKYELLTLRQPFEGHESVKEFILEGGRPSITPRDATYTVYLLDLMVLCWNQQPKDRPTASQIVSIATAPEFSTYWMWCPSITTDSLQAEQQCHYPTLQTKNCTNCG